MFLSILLSLSLFTASSPKQCFLESASLASKVEIVKPFKILRGKRGTSRRFLQRLYKEVSKRNGGSIDPRFFALAWMESRLRPRPRIGDRGRACVFIKSMHVILILCFVGREVTLVGTTKALKARG